MTEPTGGAPTPPPPQDQGGFQAPPPSSPPQLQQAPVAAGPAPGVVYADTTTRVIAYIIDVIIFAVVGVFIFGLIVLSIFAGGGAVALLGTVILAVLSLAGSAIYFVYCWTRLRASLGQRALGLETVNAADGATLTQEQAIRRWAWLFGPTAVGAVLGYAPGTLAFLGSLVGLLAFLYELYLLYTVTQSPRRQGFHDVQAGTVVVKRVG
jgi:uncharacterized RDD family membrane protein YckC